MADSTLKIAEPLLKRIRNDQNALYRVVIQLDPKQGISAAKHQVRALAKTLLDKADRSEQHIFPTADDSQPLLKARLQGKLIVGLVALDADPPDHGSPAIASVLAELDDDRSFNPDNLVRSVISVPMLNKIESAPEALQSVLIEVNVNCALGRPLAKSRVIGLVKDEMKQDDGQLLSEWKTDTSEQYVYATLSGQSIRNIVGRDGKEAPLEVQEKNKDWRAIYHIWPDFKVQAQIWRSGSTVKADACRRSFATTGHGIVWAIFDSGIDGKHLHFEKHSNLKLPSGLTHKDFTGSAVSDLAAEDLKDDYGHGTHVAGIIAGELDSKYAPMSLTREKNEKGQILFKDVLVESPVMGVAPECTLLSYKVLDKNGEGDISTVIAAIQKIQELNGFGRHIMIHGVNMSLGYNFEPEWFACGQSPVCVEVDRLVRSGVAVVIAAGNTGRSVTLAINDPGNAELAITVGATHRDMPHRYGVSYFSSRGPTGDGRPKPDLLAPGERIVSCAAGPDLQSFLKNVPPLPPDPAVKPDAKPIAYYLERSGTSMAAPHVSGIIAGILSARGEYVGLPEEVKDMLVKNATDLGRDRNFQGSGLVDMMRAIQAV